MTDRWNPKWVTRPVERELKVFVPGDPATQPPDAEDILRQVYDPAVIDEALAVDPGAIAKMWAQLTDADRTARVLNSQHRVTEHPAGFRIRERGALDATVVHSYRCPVHGLVDARVPRDAVPDALNCAARIDFRIDQGEQVCGQRATWAGSFCGQGHAAGEVMS